MKTKSLFDTLRRSADFSSCRTWRYTLIREWDDQKPRLLFVLLNPSTADAEKDDPTNRRGIGFASRWGFGSVVFVNLFAIRSPDSKTIKQVSDPIGPENDHYIERESSRANKIICAWGVQGSQSRSPEASSQADLCSRNDEERESSASAVCSRE